MKPICSHSWLGSVVCGPAVALFGIASISFAAEASLPIKSAAAPAAFKTRLAVATTRHLNALLGSDGTVNTLKGKTADGQNALAFYLLWEITKDERFRKAAVTLADRVLADMRATKFGVLPIKEKEKDDGKTIMGGGPPALGFYTTNVGYILHREGGRSDDLKYLARVLDDYAWNESGWWSSDIDVTTGESKVPLTKPAIINKSACMALAAGSLSAFVRGIDAALAARLKTKADKFIGAQLIPAQLEDGFWHYSLSENDPKNKDVLGYFMLTTGALMELQHFNPEFREPKLNAALAKAQQFALQCLAPMTDPNSGPPCVEHGTPSTPKHYTLATDTKRGFQLGLILLGAGHVDEGVKIMNAALTHFPIGNAGQDGAHASEPSALILSWLK